MSIGTLEFRDLKRQYEHIKDAVDANISSVIQSTHFIGGSEIKTLESTLAAYTGRKHCITCANGTDAITIALGAAGIGAGDAVFVPDFTFFSSGESPAIVGATPIFVDISSDTYNISVSSLEANIEKVKREGELKPAAVVAVDLFGQPFDYEAISKVCECYNLLLLEDAAQGFGGSYIDHIGTKRIAGSLGKISTTSFFPAKPLGCYGDGGAIFTDDDNLATLCRSIAVHGKDMNNPSDPNAKYNNARLGYNSRLDTLQAGVLLAKFPTFRDEELDKVDYMASLYSELLKDVPGIKLPIVEDRYRSSWAQYTIQLPTGSLSDVEQVEYRKRVQVELMSAGIPTNIYYPKPMHTQGAFEGTRSAVADCKITETLCKTVLCLPIHPYLSAEEVKYISDRLKVVIN